MAVVPQAVASTKTPAGNPSWSHTVSAGSNLGLVVIASGWQGGTTPASPTCTYGGVSLTLVHKSAASSGGDFVCIFRLLNPTVGTATVATGGIASGACHGGSISVTGLDQTTPTGTPNSAVSAALGTASTVNITSAAGELVIDGSAMGNDVTAITAGAGQTDATAPASPHWALNSGLGWGQAWASSREAGAASVTMSWSWTTSSSWAIAGVALKPAAAATKAPPPYQQRWRRLGRQRIA